ncbi:hypothetical protein KCP74_12740 [Salmonella enterica subsp. enterica]|nr:hypothetical protein KCP74_12740 [Salmonella enterica subsp. enterica]
MAGDNASTGRVTKRVARREHSEYIYLWAREGAGRSHLLHAACAELSQRYGVRWKRPLDKRVRFVPEVLDGTWNTSRWCVLITLAGVWSLAMNCQPGDGDL